MRHIFAGFTCLIMAIAVVVMVSSLGSAGVVSIRFYANPRITPAGHDINETLVNRFNEDNPDICVEYSPASGDWVTKITVEMAAGTAPDVIAGWESFFRGWLEKEQALNLNPYFTNDELEDFVPSHIQLFNIDGKQYALPHYTGVSCLFYNANMFAEAGLEPPDESWNWQTLREAARALTKVDSNHQVTQWGFAVDTAWDRFVQFIWENGGKVIAEDTFVGDRLYLDEPEAVEAVQFQHDLIWKDEVSFSPPLHGLWSHQSFWDNKLAMWQSGSWDVSNTAKHCESDWDVSVRPRGMQDGKSAIHTTDGYMVYCGTRYPEAAVCFLKWLVSPEAERIMMKQANLQPARLSLGMEYITETEFATQYNLKVFIDQTSYAKPAPMFTKHSDAMQIISDYVNRIVYNDEMPVGTGVAEMVDKVNAVLSE